MKDSDIVELYFARDERAIEETERKYGRYCRTVAYNVFANEADAEETVNDTYLGVWNSIPPQRPRIFSAKAASKPSYRAPPSAMTGSTSTSVCGPANRSRNRREKSICCAELK